MEHKPLKQSPTAYRRRKQIEEQFYKMLKAMPYQEISITDLCIDLGIPRKIFYKFYRDKEDCLNSILDSVYRESLTYTVSTIPNWSLSLNSAVVILTYWKSKKEFLDIIDSNDMISLFIKRAIVFSLREDVTTAALLDRPDIPCDQDVLTSYICSHFAMILGWHSRGFDTPLEEMAKKYLRIATQPMISGDCIS